MSNTIPSGFALCHQSDVCSVIENCGLSTEVDVYEIVTEKTDCCPEGGEREQYVKTIKVIISPVTASPATAHLGGITASCQEYAIRTCEIEESPNFHMLQKGDIFKCGTLCWRVHKEPLVMPLQGRIIKLAYATLCSTCV